jgi:hypothetical protein
MSRIRILEEKLGVNFNKLNHLRLIVDEIKGSPFSNMNKIQVIDLSEGGLNYIANSAFKLGNTRSNARYFGFYVDPKKYPTLSLIMPLYIHLRFNKLHGSSFEKGVFTDETLKNISIKLHLDNNKINYLNKQVFLPFLSSRINYLNLKNNPLDCDDCRSAWICESISVSDGESIKQYNITQFIDKDAKCSDNKRSFIDCETNFYECKSTSSSMNENFQTQIIVMIVISSALMICQA